MGPEHIVQLHLIDRKKKTALNSLSIHHSRPEPGVLRFYCGSNTVAWADQVIAPTKFRSIKADAIDATAACAAQNANARLADFGSLAGHDRADPVCNLSRRVFTKNYPVSTKLPRLRRCAR